MMIRRMLPLALAAAALVGCTGGAHSDAPGALAPGAVAPVQPARVTVDDGPVKLTGCAVKDGHVVFHGTLTGTHREVRYYTVQVEVLSAPGGDYIEDAYAFDVPAGAKPVPVEGSGTAYATNGSTFTCHVLTWNSRTRRAGRA